MVSTPASTNSAVNRTILTPASSGSATSKTAATPPVPEAPASPVPQRLAQDTVEFGENTNPAASTDAVSQTTAASKTQAVDKTAQNTAGQAAKNTGKTSQPFYQPLIDFIRNLGQKIMDIFTPTSKEAIEKALVKNGLKAEVYTARIARHELASANNTLTDAEKAVFEKDAQQARQKLQKLNTKSEKLAEKLKKFEAPTEKVPTEAKTAEATKAEAASTAEKATESAEKSGLEKSAQEATEAIDPEKTAKEFAVGLSKHLDEFSTQLKDAAPQFVEEFTNFLKKIIR